jgi:hypothetical protein
MPTLQIEHAVRNFDDWKRAFDSDPVGRERGGVRAYRVQRPVDDSAYVIVELEFNSTSEAEAFRAELEKMWARVAGQGLIEQPRARIVETLESIEY